MDRIRNTLTLTSWDDESPVFSLVATIGTNIPAGNYKLKEGKFPLLTVEDLFEKSNKYHTLVSVVSGNEYKIKVTGFGVGCRSKYDNTRYSSCKVYFEDGVDFKSDGENKLTLKTWDDINPVFSLTSKDTTKIPNGSYKLKEGKFPLLTVEDFYENSQKYHTLVSLDGSNEYKIKVTGFGVGCRSKYDNTRLGGCTVNFENEDFKSDGGRRRPSKKRATPRRRSSKSRKSRSTRRN